MSIKLACCGHSHSVFPYTKRLRVVVLIQRFAKDTTVTVKEKCPLNATVLSNDCKTEVKCLQIQTFPGKLIFGQAQTIV